MKWPLKVYFFFFFCFHFKIHPDSVSLVFLSYLHSPCLSGNLLRFPVGHRPTPPTPVDKAHIKWCSNADVARHAGIFRDGKTNKVWALELKLSNEVWEAGDVNACLCVSVSLAHSVFLPHSFTHSLAQKQPSGCHQEKTTYLSAVSNKTPNSANTFFLAVNSM